MRGRRSAATLALPRLITWILVAVMLLSGHPDASHATLAQTPRLGVGLEKEVIEDLRLRVPAEARQAWAKVERESWEPWLRSQPGFLRRELLWDPLRQEGTLHIHWASRAQWKAIPSEEVEAVQERFEELARRAMGLTSGNPFPLIHSGELEPL